MPKETAQEIITNDRDVFTMLDTLLQKRDGDWWDAFYKDRSRPVSFFANMPDEDLAAFCREGLFSPGRALDIGCGNGRNTRFLAGQGFDAVGLDLSAASVAWAREASQGMEKTPFFAAKSFLDYTPEAPFDLILDSGCFHHIKPHQRQAYLTKVQNCLAPDGYFLMTCFDTTGGADITDYDVYRDLSMHGGLGFSEEKIKTILNRYFKIIRFRKMQKQIGTGLYGEDFLWVILMQKS